MKTKVLVTGSDGQLGQTLQSLASNHPTIEFQFTNSRALDITNKVSVQSVFEKQPYHYCINCAAYTAVDLAEKEQEQAFLVNAEGARNLAEACQLHDVILIHISTDYVFDGTKSTPYTEEDQPNPINVYGKSKLAGEQHIQEILERYFIIRTSWLYSEYGNNFVKTILRLAEEKEEISVVDDQISTPTYALDLALVIIHIIKLNSTACGVYHFSNLGVASWYDFANEIIKLTNFRTKVIAVNSDVIKSIATRPLFSNLDKTKIIEMFNLTIPHWQVSLKLCKLIY